MAIFAACACCCTGIVRLALLLAWLVSEVALLTASFTVIDVAVVVALKVACTLQVELEPDGNEPIAHTSGLGGTPVMHEALINCSSLENPVASWTDVATAGPRFDAF